MMLLKGKLTDLLMFGICDGNGYSNGYGYNGDGYGCGYGYGDGYSNRENNGLEILNED